MLIPFLPSDPVSIELCFVYAIYIKLVLFKPTFCSAVVKKMSLLSNIVL